MPNDDGKPLRLDPQAESASPDLPAFLARPANAPVYYGFVIVDGSQTDDGWAFGTITDFEDPEGCDYGDAFVIAPDGTRAGIAWQVDDLLKTQKTGQVRFLSAPGAIRAVRGMRQVYRQNRGNTNIAPVPFSVLASRRKFVLGTVFLGASRWPPQIVIRYPGMSDNYADEGYVEEAVRIAEAVLAGSTSIIDGCRRVWKPLHKNFVDDDPSFAVISEVCAKVSSFPMPEDRHLWDQNVVRVKDAELAEWLPSVQERVLTACREIVRRFGDAG